jgi:hypothetical protein
MGNRIQFLQLLRHKNLATLQKTYQAVLIDPHSRQKRTLRRKFSRASLAEIYACAVASRISRWLAAKS